MSEAIDIDQDARRETSLDGTSRSIRSLSDKILIAVHQACDQSDFEVAGYLLHTLEMIATRPPRIADRVRRRNVGGLVAAHERIWLMRHLNANIF
jgi:hypothetical protein